MDGRHQWVWKKVVKVKSFVERRKFEMKMMEKVLEDDCRAFHEDVSSMEIQQVVWDMAGLGARNVDVAEIYSPPRFTEACARHHLVPGIAVDPETGWDLMQDEQVEELERQIVQMDPYLVTGSPPCEAFSNLLHISKAKRDPMSIEEDLRVGRHHLATAARVYMQRHLVGKYFLHEHPAYAKSWKEDCIQKIMEMDGVYLVKGPMCRWGMMSEDASGPGYVRKETGWLTNSSELARILEGMCSRVYGDWHRHVHLINGRAARAKRYPPKLVSAVLKGIKKQMVLDGVLTNVSSLASGPEPDRDY